MEMVAGLIVLLISFVMGVIVGAIEGNRKEDRILEVLEAVRNHRDFLLAKETVCEYTRDSELHLWKNCRGNIQIILGKEHVFCHQCGGRIIYKEI